MYPFDVPEIAICALLSMSYVPATQDPGCTSSTQLCGVALVGVVVVEGVVPEAGEVNAVGEAEPAEGEAEPESATADGVILTGEASLPDDRDSTPPTNITAKIMTIIIITIYIED